MRDEPEGSGDANSVFAHVQRLISRGIVLAGNTGRFENRAMFFFDLFRDPVLEAGGEDPSAAKNIGKALSLGTELCWRSFSFRV